MEDPGLHLTQGFLGPPESTSQTSPWLVQPFLYGWRMCPKDTHRQHQETRIIGNDKLHLAQMPSAAMWPNNNWKLFEMTHLHVSNTLVSLVTKPAVHSGNALNWGHKAGLKITETNHARKIEWWDAGVVICLEWGADLHMSQLMPMPLTVSFFSKIQIGFTFLVPAHLGSPGKRAVKRVCV